MHSDIEAWRNSRVVTTSFGFGWLVRFIYSLNFTACNWRLTASYIKRGLQALHVGTPKALFVEKFNISASTYVSSIDSYAVMSDQTWSYFTCRGYRSCIYYFTFQLSKSSCTRKIFIRCNETFHQTSHCRLLARQFYHVSFLLNAFYYFFASRCFIITLTTQRLGWFLGC